MFVSRLVQTIKFVLFLQLLFLFMIHSYVFSLLNRDLWAFRKKTIHLMSRYCWIALRLMNIQVKKCGLIDNAPRKFIVSNHMSYLDVLILASQFPTTFVTSMEIKETPGLGLITKLGGCLYVERRNKSNLSNEIKEVTEALRQNIPVTVFPEATSTNGESVLRFKKPLFQAAVESQSDISPVCINYLKIDGQPFQFSNRDYLCWYGDMDFIPHLWKLMGLKEVLVELRLFKNISPAETPEPLFLAERSHSLIREKFIPAAVL